MSLIAALLLASSTAHPQPFPVRAGDCRWVRGEFISANGSGLRRIWVIGTKHILYLHDGDEDVPDSRFSYAHLPPPTGALYRGDFYVCALENFIPGSMQRVRLKGARKILNVHK
jgi:hypothetical protein